MQLLSHLGLIVAAGTLLQSEASPQTLIQVQTDKIYYQLPRWSVGAKMTAYASDYAGGDYPSDPRHAKRTTADGKTWLDCISEMKLGFLGASMVNQGRPPNKGKPNRYYDDWRVAANAVVRAGGAVMIEYMAGVDGMPHGTKTPPEAASNVNPDPGEWSVQNCLDWADYMASLHGSDKIRLAEFYNEPATMSDRQLGRYGSYWYSTNDFKNDDRLSADWASNHQQDYYKAFKAKYPNAIICGGSYSEPAGIYSAKEGARYLKGYPGARISAENPNTLYQDALSLHCYGYKSGSNVFNTPGAPAGGIQSIFNSIFYPELKNPSLVSGYKAGVDQWLGIARSLPGGESNKLVDSEWWAYTPQAVAGWYPAGGVEGSHQAVADVLGWIVHCQNADRWQFNALQYHAVNVCSGRKTNALGCPTEINLPDAYFCESRGKLWRLGRYYAVKDVCCHFANNYQTLVRCSVQGPPSARNNSPGTQIQACTGLSQSRTSLGVCLANIGDTAQKVVITLPRAATHLPSSVEVPNSLDPETALRPSLTLRFTDDSHKSVALDLDGYSAALLEIQF